MPTTSSPSHCRVLRFKFCLELCLEFLPHSSLLVDCVCALNSRRVGVAILLLAQEQQVVNNDGRRKHRTQTAQFVIHNRWLLTPRKHCFEISMGIL
mmetsp:Transcript_14659/g.29792  ORF Transcript_14659/g.29792 Transcript_14659/m.29792 type:complete len:96 (+) Transcript_14659:1977-2264(+)